MKHFLKSKLYVFLVRLGQLILFAIPLVVFMIIYKDIFFTASTGVGLTGLGILGLLIWALCLAKVFGKLPKIMYFAMICVLFTAMDMLSGFLKQLGWCILIGAILALPLNTIIFALNEDGVVDLRERSKVKAKKRMKKEKITVDVE